jgi:hypothetical protein
MTLEKEKKDRVSLPRDEKSEEEGNERNEYDEKDSDTGGVARRERRVHLVDLISPESRSASEGIRRGEGGETHDELRHVRPRILRHSIHNECTAGVRHLADW